jgi:Tfp pilus assembly protein PilV
MFLRSLQRLNQRGDTIVEVLVAIGVLSLILGGAYVLTNRSLQATRASQERVNATKLIETQLEQIKNLAKTNHDAVFGSATPESFCINMSAQVKASTDGQCSMGPDGAPTSKEPIYHVSVKRSGNTFTATNSWASITGDKVETVVMSYRIYE